MEHGMMDPRLMAQARRAHAGGGMPSPLGAGGVPEMMGMGLGGVTPNPQGDRGGYVGPVMPGAQRPASPPPGTPPPYVGPPGMNNFTEDEVNRVFMYPEGPERVRAQYQIRSQYHPS